MLEIKNVFKTYKPKKGVPVKALDGVSLSFADTGLVFILGKSGSGKSTLLNVIGGLDTADSGEFSIKGKSSKDFSQADFDSYRNTFIGFIFQEYNILNEFTVGQNIALAMKLQGKKVDDKSLNAILEEVDLVGYANRKPNELSGGQKQRVAIARALIKEPEIIMADEPTGALDSNTGKQVFDTLKKLSENKLVIVVSHDREFAEYYGDRVIELADGKIISDITKETAESRKESEGLSVVDDKILHIRKGYRLTPDDLDKIQRYLDGAESDTIISMDERSNATFCQIARIDEDGNQEVFRDTDNAVLSEENKKYDGSSKFIRSKLPYSHAFKIGSSSLKTKPFRLFMTILLCFISFAMFGLADTVGSYNKVKTTVNSIVDSNYDSVAFGAKIRNGEYYSTVNGGSLKDLERIEEKSGIKFTGVAAGSDRFNVFESNKLMGANYSNYYMQTIKGYLPAGEENFQKYGFTNLTGRQPIASNELVITKYIYDHFALAGLVCTSKDGKQEVIKPTDFSNEKEFLDLSPSISVSNYNAAGKDKNWKIVGIVDTKADPSGRFDALKPSENANNDNISTYLLSAECEQYFSYGYHSLGYVSKEAYDSIINGLVSSSESAIGVSVQGFMNFQCGNSYYSLDFAQSANDEALSQLEILWLDGERTTLADNEYVININTAESYNYFNYINYDNIGETEIKYSKNYFAGMVQVRLSTFNELQNAHYDVGYYEAANDLTLEQIEKFREYVKSIQDDYNEGVMKEYIYALARSANTYSYGISCNYDGLEENIDLMSPHELKFLYSGYLKENYNFGIYDYETHDYIYIPGGGRENAIGLDCGKVAREYYGMKWYYPLCMEALDISTISLSRVEHYIKNGGGYKSFEDGKIVGFYMKKGSVDENGELNRDRNDIVINNELYKMAQNNEPLIYSFFIAPMPQDKETIEKLVNIHYDESADRGLEMQNGVTFMLDMVNELLEMLGQIFLYVGIGLAVFSMLLLSNYIAVSITYKKREIGILRAVGAKSSDVFSIFFSESLVIALINFVIAAVVCGVGCMLLNNMLRNEYGLQITLLNFGIRQIAVMLLISVAVAVISSFLPVYRLSRKKPIETIRTA